MSDQLANTISQWDDIRTVKLDGELWYVLKDFCVKLGIENLDQVVNRLDSTGVKLADVTDSMGRTRNVRVINKPNLISFLARSNKPEAFSLLDWMYRQVIASAQSPAVGALQQQLAALQQENANLRQQVVMHQEIAEKALRIETVQGLSLDDSMRIDIALMRNSQLNKRAEAALKSAKHQHMLDVMREREREVETLAEYTRKTDEILMAVSGQFAKQSEILKQFHQQAQNLLPPAQREQQKQISQEGTN